jgi:PRC-barrel domain
MNVLKPLRLSAGVLVSIPFSFAVAQTQLPTSPSTGTLPQATTPLPPAQQQVHQPATPSDAATTTAGKPLLGLSVFSSQGAKLGSVGTVERGVNGTITAIYLKTGGFLGFGGKRVAIPVGKFTQDTDKIVVHMSEDEVNKLPAVED